GAHILHAGPSCIIQPSTSGPRADPLHLKHHRGICYSSLLCKQKGGVAAGKCGLGNACCIFPQSCSSIALKKLVYFTNTDYPEQSVVNQNSSDCSLTIHRMPGVHPICQLRLDFIEYDIEGHNEAAMSINEANGIVGEEESRVNAIDYESSVAADCKTDRITMRTMHSEEDIVPPICARKIGHHVMIDVRKHIGPFILTVHAPRHGYPRQSTRRWNILINQIECNRLDGSSGRILSLINRNLNRS
ncbi:hypothetical protein TYRP_000304, partial [Tyrophagus putrescentiae]